MCCGLLLCSLYCFLLSGGAFGFLLLSDAVSLLCLLCFLYVCWCAVLLFLLSALSVLFFVYLLCCDAVLYYVVSWGAGL